MKISVGITLILPIALMSCNNSNPDASEKKNGQSSMVKHGKNGRHGENGEDGQNGGNGGNGGHSFWGRGGDGGNATPTQMNGQVDK